MHPHPLYKFVKRVGQNQFKTRLMVLRQTFIPCNDPQQLFQFVLNFILITIGFPLYTND